MGIFPVSDIVCQSTVTLRKLIRFRAILTWRCLSYQSYSNSAYREKETLRPATVYVNNI